MTATFGKNNFLYLEKLNQEKASKLKYHLLLSRPIDLKGVARDVQAGKCPRHMMWELSQRLGAAIHTPGAEPVLPQDKIRAKIAGRPEHWALARALSQQLKRDDVIFCTGEDIGIPVATLCGGKQDRPKIAVHFHNIDRPRGRAALKLFDLANSIDLFIVCASPQADFLRRYLRLPEERICIVADQTDTAFFTPGLADPNKRRPMIASIGLEQRNYHTLAEATQDLNIDVKTTGFSKDATALARAFPKTMPANMSRRFYDWPDLVQLYRDADLVAISLFENNYAAGIQGLLEAMACKRPVVIAQTNGLRDYLAPLGIATLVNPGDPVGLRRAIVNLLKNPEEAEAQAQRGYEFVLKHYNSDRYIHDLATQLASI